MSCSIRRTARKPTKDPGQVAFLTCATRRQPSTDPADGLEGLKRMKDIVIAILYVGMVIGPAILAFFTKPVE
jgi:hypothetical protein